MSLDVYLVSPTQPVVLVASQKIFIREDGQTKEISRDEWDQRFPGREPVVCCTEDTTLYRGNVTHNLGTMASNAGLYGYLWRPEEHGIVCARDLIVPLTHGLENLEADPERYKKDNPPNGWGNYDVLVMFVRNYLAACREWPDALVRTWR